MTKQLVKQKAENLGVENIVFRLLMEPSDIKNTFFIVVMGEILISSILKKILACNI